MPATRPRRTLLKRACLWTGAVVLFLASYLASVPFAAVVHNRYPAATPIVMIVYAPVILILGVDSKPTDNWYTAYKWTEEKLLEMFPL